MSASSGSRQEAREQARAERERREDEAALRERRKRRLIYVGGLLGLIVIVAVVVAVASGGGSGSSSGTTSSGGAVKNAAAVRSEFAGIPQKGNVLGSANAKATMMVFADVQCPFCRDFDTRALPSLVSRYVKTGELKVVFQPISIIGADSVAGARAVAAAAQQNKLFQYSSLFYWNQGQENTGYVTDAFLTKLAHAVPGLNVSKWKADLNSANSSALLSRAQAAAQTAGVNSTPTFMVAKTGQTLRPFQPSSLTANAFYGELSSLTK
jgi:protein-disulfide isomerase